MISASLSGALSCLTSGIGVERRTHLPERPALDEYEFGLRDLACGELVQQGKRRDAAADLDSCRP